MKLPPPKHTRQTIDPDFHLKPRENVALPLNSSTKSMSIPETDGNEKLDSRHSTTNNEISVSSTSIKENSFHAPYIDRNRKYTFRPPHYSNHPCLVIKGFLEGVPMFEHHATCALSDRCSVADMLFLSSDDIEPVGDIPIHKSQAEVVEMERIKSSTDKFSAALRTSNRTHTSQLDDSCMPFATHGYRKAYVEDGDTELPSESKSESDDEDLESNDASQSVMYTPSSSPGQLSDHHDEDVSTSASPCSINTPQSSIHGINLEESVNTSKIPLQIPKFDYYKVPSMSNSAFEEHCERYMSVVLPKQELWGPAGKLASVANSSKSMGYNPIFVTEQGNIKETRNKEVASGLFSVASEPKRLMRKSPKDIASRVLSKYNHGEYRELPDQHIFVEHYDHNTEEERLDILTSIFAEVNNTHNGDIERTIAKLEEQVFHISIFACILFMIAAYFMWDQWSLEVAYNVQSRQQVGILADLQSVLGTYPGYTPLHLDNSEPYDGVVSKITAAIVDLEYALSICSSQNRGQKAELEFSKELQLYHESELRDLVPFKKLVLDVGDGDGCLTTFKLTHKGDAPILDLGIIQTKSCNFTKKFAEINKSFWTVRLSNATPNDHGAGDEETWYIGGFWSEWSAHTRVWELLKLLFSRFGGGYPVWDPPTKT